MLDTSWTRGESDPASRSPLKQLPLLDDHSVLDLSQLAIRSFGCVSKLEFLSVIIRYSNINVVATSYTISTPEKMPVKIRFAAFLVALLGDTSRI